LFSGESVNERKEEMTKKKYSDMTEQEKKEVKKK
jgi:hypothetical protein